MRIHVERVIGLLRQKSTILQSTLPLDYLTCSKNTANCPLIAGAAEQIFKWGGGANATRKREPTRGIQGHAPPGKFEILFF